HDHALALIARCAHRGETHPTGCVHRGLTAAVLMSQVNDEGGKIMATTTVRKGQNRKAAEAKRAKHAQHTPLPARPMEIVSDGERVADNFDALGLPELRQLARAQGWSTLDSVTKPQLVTALREHPGGAPADAQPLGQPKPKTSGNRKE